MRAHRRIIIIALTGLLAPPLTDALKAGPKSESVNIREGAYYEFRGHISDRDTLTRRFTLGWDKGSQEITVISDTKIFRKGKAAKLEEAKAGDAVRGIGQAKNGRLIATAVAFGDDGVELPASVKMPEPLSSLAHTARTDN